MAPEVIPWLSHAAGSHGRIQEYFLATLPCHFSVVLVYVQCLHLFCLGASALLLFMLCVSPWGLLLLSWCLLLIYFGLSRKEEEKWQKRNSTSDLTRSPPLLMREYLVATNSLVFLTSVFPFIVAYLLGIKQTKVQELSSIICEWFELYYQAVRSSSKACSTPIYLRTIEKSHQ